MIGTQMSGFSTYALTTLQYNLFENPQFDLPRR